MKDIGAFFSLRKERAERNSLPKNREGIPPQDEIAKVTCAHPSKGRRGSLS